MFLRQANNFLVQFFLRRHFLGKFKEDLLLIIQYTSKFLQLMEIKRSRIFLWLNNVLSTCFRILSRCKLLSLLFQNAFATYKTVPLILKNILTKLLCSSFNFLLKIVENNSIQLLIFFKLYCTKMAFGIFHLLACKNFSSYQNKKQCSSL